MESNSLQEYFEIVSRVPDRIKNKKVSIIDMLFSEQEHRVTLKVKVKDNIYEVDLQTKDKSSLEYIDDYELEDVIFTFKDSSITEIILYEILNCFQVFVKNYSIRKYTTIENNMQKIMLSMLYKDNI